MAKAKKEPVNTELVTTAIGISSELRQIVEQIEANGGECDDATLAALQGWQAALEVKAESIAHVKLRLEADAAYWQQYEDAARAMRKSKEAAVKRLTDYLALCMATAGVKSIKRDDGLFSISLQQGRASVRIIDEKKIPFDLADVVELVKPRKGEIEERLKAGEQVPGA
ncbi:MAG TPA: siphovirus Gp157 family protein, partial [Candidatus Rifleibacterium sp.]|nr:siphovirus Gp157 family protein [Candidatus Rifleibacterium sp.]